MTQPEALRLADWLEDQYDPTHNQAQAAAFLRQLHEANEAFGKRQEWWNERMFVLEQQRDALLEALKTVEWRGDGSCWVVDADKIAAAIAKAEENKYE